MSWTVTFTCRLLGAGDTDGLYTGAGATEGTPVAMAA